MSRRRTALRVTLATAALAGAVLAPVSAAFAADAAPASASGHAPITEKRLPDGNKAIIYPMSAHNFTAVIVSPRNAELAVLGAKYPVYRHGSWVIKLNARTGQITADRVKPVPNCQVTKETGAGAGTMALLKTDLNGPHAAFLDGDTHKRFTVWLDRKHPVLPKRYGFMAKIVGANTKHPKLVFNFEGGGHPSATVTFPALPASCHR
ncbi:hypothetical protein [Streptomyces orinoci]|uniref:Uncharacterized protein n=1 Tax=Streptomyces orinoci TaxID=67339 RepID=A0ABV3K5U8_STRON|nr:hypothetical protein [Streptomyces orinoci]